MRVRLAFVLLLAGAGCQGKQTLTFGGSILEPSGGSTRAGADAGSTGPGTAPAATPERTLFVGNSFTAVNDLPGTYRTLTGTIPSATTAEVDSVTYDGYTLAQHAADAQGTGRIATLLDTAAGAPPVSWSHVVLQEQSEFSGVGPDNPEHQKSLDAAVALARDAVATGATPVLFMTWGYEAGDPLNPSLFPDYPTMQSRIEEGYREMAGAIAGVGMPVVIAPAGLAFKAAYDADVAAGKDPKGQGALFASLYAGDGKHPGLAGTYVTAWVMAGMIYDVDPTSAASDRVAVDAATKAQLRAIARDVVAAERAREGG